MKKLVIKIVVFVLLFAVAFGAAQSVLRYHWPEDTYTRYRDFENQPKDSIDVFVFGTSEMQAGYEPVAAYYAAGITGYNFSLQNRSAMATYYQLKYALKHHTPKVVVCDFVCLFDNELPSEFETIYRRVVDTMPDRKIKKEIIQEICKVDDSQSPLNWYLPMIRYHSMWNELTSDDFAGNNVYDKNYPDYKKGVNLLPQSNFDGAYDIVPELWESDMEPNELADFSVQYYDKLIEECKSRGIEVVCVLTPKVCDAAVYQVNWPKMQEYFDSRGVKYINYCTYDRIKQMGLNMYEDYADSAHLNVYGALKFSTVVGQDISKMCNLSDRRGDKESSVTQSWDNAWENMVLYYGSQDNQ